jgi:hypothetical protein
VNDSDLLEGLLIGTAAPTGLAFAHVVVSGAGHPESLAEFSDREVRPLSGNQRIPLCGSSESEQEIDGFLTEVLVIVAMG